MTSLTGVLRGIARCLPKKVKYLVYNALVKPHIDYLIEVWGLAAKSNTKIIQTSQNKLIKTLFNYDFDTPTVNLYKKTKIMNITQTFTYYTCILVRKILMKDMHSQIIFTKKHQIQNKKLRNANDLVLRPPRTNYGKHNITFLSAQIYNRLPKDIKQIKTMSLFKKVLKTYLCNQSVP